MSPPVVAERPWILVALVLGATVHIASVFALPRLAPRTAFERLAALGPANAFHSLPRAAPGTALVLDRDPAMASAACRYDLGRGPLRVTGRLQGDNLFMLSFHGRDGVVFYALTDKGLSRRTVDVTLLTQAQSDALQARTPEDEPTPELRLVAPEREGFVFARALAAQSSDYGNVETQLAGLACATAAAPKPEASR